MRNLALIATVTALTAVLGAGNVGLSLNAQNNQLPASECTGWVSEISEISGALFDQIEPNRSDVIDALYELEVLAEQKCESGREFDFEIAEGISKVSKILEKEIMNDKKSTNPERVLTQALLKLIQNGMPVSLSMN